MGYFIVRRGEEVSSYQITSTADQPRLAMSNGYIPLVTGPTNNPTIVANTYGTTLRLGEYQTTSVRSTTTVKVKSYYGNAGTQTTTTAYYNSSVPSNNAGYNGVMSNTTALTQSSTSGYSGISSRASDYETTRESPYYENTTSGQTITGFDSSYPIVSYTDSCGLVPGDLPGFQTINAVNATSVRWTFSYITHKAWYKQNANGYYAIGQVTYRDAITASYTGNGMYYKQNFTEYTGNFTYWESFSNTWSMAGDYHNITRNGMNYTATVANMRSGTMQDYYSDTDYIRVEGSSSGYSYSGTLNSTGGCTMVTGRKSFMSTKAFGLMQVDCGIEVTGPYGQTAHKTTSVQRSDSYSYLNAVDCQVLSTRVSYYGTTRRSDFYNSAPSAGVMSNVTTLTCSSTSGYSGRSSSTGTQSSTQSRSSFYTSQGSLSSTSSSVYSVQTTTTVTVSTTAQSTTLTGGGYNVIGGAIVVNPGQPITCSVSTYSTQSAQTTDNRLSTYNTTLYTTVYLSKSSMCSSSYGAQTSSYATTSATTTVSSTTFA